MPTKSAPQAFSSEELGAAEKRQRLSAPVTTPRKVIVTIGIDFGTSSTKVMFRFPETKAKPFICLFDGNPDGYPPVGIPSTVRVSDDRVYFGAHAETLVDGIVFRSFKTCLRCKLVDNQCINCADGPKHSPGHRYLPDGQNDVSPEELAVWYLAYVICQVKKRVLARYGEDVLLYFNLAAPMDMIQTPTGRKHYERAVFLANKLADLSVEQGMDLERLRYFYHQLCTDHPSLPDEASRTTFVIAETRAGMVAYSNSRAAVKGLYALVDIGAGTTDMTIFRLPDDPHALQFYAAGVEAVGADAVDSLLLDEMAKIQPSAKDPTRRSDSLGRIRVAKETGAHEQMFTKEAYGQASARVADELFKRYRKHWHSAYKKEIGVQRWQEMTVFLIGGGSNLPGLSEILSQSPWEKQVPSARVRKLNLPDEIACDGDGSQETVVQYEGLLMVAYGLSYPYAVLSAYEMPDMVEPLGGPPARPLKPSWDNSDWDPY